MTKFEWFLVILVGFALALVAEIAINDSNRYVKYDCRLAEISPDTPVEVKNMCRSMKK